jgi:hypothetical protein
VTVALQKNLKFNTCLLFASRFNSSGSSRAAALIYFLFIYIDIRINMHHAPLKLLALIGRRSVFETTDWLLTITREAISMTTAPRPPCT